jgi:hypothetical protein
MRKAMWISILLGTLSICRYTRAEKPVFPAFKNLQALAGDWQGKDDSGMAAKTTFKLVVANTTVMETLSAHGMEEMLTLYTVERDGIALVHYCPTNTQPRMRAIPKSADVKELDFQFMGAGNLAVLAMGHEQRLVLRFKRRKPHHRRMDLEEERQGPGNGLRICARKQIVMRSKGAHRELHINLAQFRNVSARVEVS